MRKQSTLAEFYIQDDDNDNFLVLKLQKDMDSFDRFLEDLDPIQSSSNLDKNCLAVATAAEQHLIDGLQDEDIILSDTSDEETELYMLETMHHSGDLERLFKPKPSTTMRLKKGQRDPTTTTTVHSPQTLSPQKDPSIPKRPSSSRSLKDSPQSLRGKALKSYSINKIECKESPSRSSRPTRKSLSQTEHGPKTLSFYRSRNDDLNKTDHTPKVHRIRRDELYSLRRKYKSITGLVESPIANSTQPQVRQRRRVMMSPDKEAPRSLERSRSLQCRQHTTTRRQPWSRSSRFDWPSETPTDQHSIPGTTRIRKQGINKRVSPIVESNNRSSLRPRSRSRCKSEDDKALTLPQRCNKIMIVGGEIIDNNKIKVSMSPTVSKSRKLPDASSLSEQDGGNNNNHEDHDFVGDLLRDLRRESKRYLLRKIGGGAKRNLLAEKISE
jgi:hypothetical protein